MITSAGDIFLISDQESHMAVSEAFRTIRTSLTYMFFDKGNQTLLFTSPIRGEGKTTVLANLGILTAWDGKNVLLIDGDFRHPHLHHLFRTSNRFGLSSILSGYSGLEQSTVPSHVPGLTILPTGPIQPNPSELLGNPRLEAILAECHSQYDVIFIDSPPVLSVADACILARVSQGILMIVRSKFTKKDQILKAQKALEPSRDKLLGVVVNEKSEKERSIL